MGQPHKRAELIKAWADGAEIQRYSPVNGWQDIYTQPQWDNFCEQFRIKPKTVKYKLYIYTRNFGGLCVHICTDPDSVVYYETSATFVKWLGDWQEVEVS